MDKIIEYYLLSVCAFSPLRIFVLVSSTIYHDIFMLWPLWVLLFFKNLLVLKKEYIV